MPGANFFEERRRAVQHAHDKGCHNCEKWPVFTARNHGDYGCEAIYAVEIHEVGDESVNVGDTRGGQKIEHGSEIGWWD